FALTDLVTLVAVPGTGFIDQIALNPQVDDFAHVVNALTVHNLEFGLFKRRRHFVFNHFDAGFVTHHFITLLHRAGTTDIQTHRGVEFQGVTTGGGFRAAEHHADFHADLVNKDHQTVGVFHVTGQFTQRL